MVDGIEQGGLAAVRGVEVAIPYACVARTQPTLTADAERGGAGELAYAVASAAVQRGGEDVGLAPVGGAVGAVVAEPKAETDLALGVDADGLSEGHIADVPAAAAVLGVRRGVRALVDQQVAVVVAVVADLQPAGLRVGRAGVLAAGVEAPIAVRVPGVAGCDDAGPLDAPPVPFTGAQTVPQVPQFSGSESVS